MRPESNVMFIQAFFCFYIFLREWTKTSIVTFGTPLASIAVYEMDCYVKTIILCKIPSFSAYLITSPSLSPEITCSLPKATRHWISSPHFVSLVKWVFRVLLYLSSLLLVSLYGLFFSISHLLLFCMSLLFVLKSFVTCEHLLSFVTFAFLLFYLTCRISI